MSEQQPPSLLDLLRQRQALQAAAARDPRYPVEAYLFVCDAVDHTCRKLGKRRDVRARELLDGICDLALERYGYLASAVFEHWGIGRTDDFGEIVFNLIEVGLLGKSPSERREDFRDVLDLRRTLDERYDIPVDRGEAGGDDAQS